MIILFEGVDGSGKTTLIEKTSKYLISQNKDVITLHLSKPNNDIDSIYDNLNQYLTKYKVDKNLENKKQQTFILIDRAIISNLAYNTIYNNQPIISAIFAYDFFRLVDKIVFCHITNKNYWKELFISDKNKGKNEMYSFDDRLLGVYNFYDTIINKDNNTLKKLISQQQNLSPMDKEELLDITDFMLGYRDKYIYQLDLYKDFNSNSLSFLKEYI